jgi:hypothetical protein
MKSRLCQRIVSILRVKTITQTQGKKPSSRKRFLKFKITLGILVCVQLVAPTQLTTTAYGSTFGSASFRGDAMLIGSNMPAPGLSDFTYEFFFEMDSLPSLAESAKGFSQNTCIPAFSNCLTCS